MRRINNVFFKISLIAIFIIPFLQVGNITNLGKIVRYSYGIPFGFIEIYKKNYEENWLVNNLFNGNEGININIIIYIINVLILYFFINVIVYLYRKFKHKKF